MSKSSEYFAMRGDDAVEALLEKAAPRPAPPSGDEKIVRAAVYAEWQAVAGKVRVRRRLSYVAVAATVVLGIVVAFNALQVSNAPAVQIATISKSHGSIYLLGEQSELREMTGRASIFAGQIIETGDDAGIGLKWGNGGSLRVDESTRIEFKSADTVYLRSGQIYFDSQATSGMVAAITGSGLEIETGHGSVTHLGTQFMTAVDTKNLTVSVREGEVVVDGTYASKAVAYAGQQLTVSGGAKPSVLDIDGFGESWDWIEATAPNVNMDGRSAYEFLQRIGRETGMQVEFETAAAEAKAHAGTQYGTFDVSPREELALRMSGEDLSYRIDRGTIYVSAIDSGSRP